MAFTGLLALLDDVATLTQKTAVMTKVAAGKTVGVVGDDLAVSAGSMAKIEADRELFVVLAIAKGSFKNKALLVVGALLLNTLFPWALTPLLLLGGAYLCFEGGEKILHLFQKTHAQDVEEEIPEAEKIKGAIRTDLILSLEIMVIALSTIATESLTVQAIVLSVVAILMTIGVYGVVAAIIRIDNLGLWMQKQASILSYIIGGYLITWLPYLMKTIAVLGTAAMFTVGGGIFFHSITHYSKSFHHFLAPYESFSILIHGVGGVLIGLALSTSFVALQKYREI